MGADGFFEHKVETAIEARGVRCPTPDAGRADEAAHAFARDHADYSARQPMVPAQTRVAVQLAGALGIAGLVAPDLLLMAVSAIGLLVFALVLMWRCILVTAACLRAPEAEPASPDPDIFPIYTVLIALYDEAVSMAQLAVAMSALDYPADRLDLKLLIETGDAATEDAIRCEAWPEGTELHIVPPGDPQTKPRALNYGLATARGAYVVVYDAEDRPDASQLKAAARAFAAGPERLACVQAPLVGTGSQGSWLAGHWALEYASQFGHVLPSLARFGLPIALGGTSNHLKRAALERVGGWDAWNVTEDADLGLRFARHGLQVETITPPTLEAPPRRLLVWIAQRSRWLKGFLQTWLVLMRHPAKAIRKMGWGGFVSMQLTLGGALLSALAHGPWALWCLACVISPHLSMGPITSAAMAVSYTCGLAIAVAAPGARSGTRWLHILTLPLYWPLQSIAMARAIFGMIRCPHFWAKTPHD